jgi:TAG lipase/lysophosphatidylethanolamine acyltransferase
MMNGKPFPTHLVHTTDCRNNRRHNPDSAYYERVNIEQRITALQAARTQGDVTETANLIRSGLIRNFASITSAQLYNQAYGGTKKVIEEYVRQVVLCVDQITNSPTTSTSNTSITKQEKLNILNDAKRSFGKSALVLQGGAVFGLCHLGVGI